PAASGSRRRRRGFNVPISNWSHPTTGALDETQPGGKEFLLRVCAQKWVPPGKISALAGAAEQLDLLLALVDDGLCAGGQQLAGVEALALQILAGLDVLAGGLGKDQLALGVDVDLAHAQADGLGDHLVGDA